MCRNDITCSEFIAESLAFLVEQNRRTARQVKIGIIVGKSRANCLKPALFQRPKAQETNCTACLILRIQPRDAAERNLIADAWLDMALLKDSLGQTQATYAAIISAFQTSESVVMKRMASNERLKALIAKLQELNSRRRQAAPASSLLP